MVTGFLGQKFTYVGNGLNTASTAVKNGKISQGDFLKEWSGVLLYAETAPESGEENYRSQKVLEYLQMVKWPFMVLLTFVLLLSAFSFPLNGVFFLIQSFLALAGLATSILLLLSSFDANNPFVQNLCSFGNKNNCNAILKSDAAKLTPWLSWSELGLFYFAGCSLSLLFVGENAWAWLCLLNLLALPYTLYSVYYQWRAKNWCLLCCTVQVLFCLQFLAFIAQGWALPETWADFVPVLFGFLAPIAIWALLKPLINQSLQTEPLQKQLNKFKYNPSLFQQVLSKEKKVEVPDGISIKLGNPTAPHAITMVSNPYCGPCAKTHRTLDEWLQKRDDIQLEIVFTGSREPSDKRLSVVKHLMAYSQSKPTAELTGMLNDWYEQPLKNYEGWAQKYPIQFNGEMDKLVQRQKDWCDSVGIQFTPSIFVNGHQLPELYRLEDLNYLLT